MDWADLKTMLTPALLNERDRNAMYPYLGMVPGPIGMGSQVAQNVEEQGVLKGLLGSAATMATPAIVSGLLGKAAGGVTRQIVKNKELEERAKKHFGKTFSADETGYVLDDGTRLDLSGRHTAGFGRNSIGQNVPPQGEQDWFRGKRFTDHRDIFEVTGKGGDWDALSSFIDETGAVRYMPNVGVSTVDTNKPSQAQIEKIVSDFRRRGNALVWDVDSKATGYSVASKEFEKPTVESVMKWLDSVYGNK